MQLADLVEKKRELFESVAKEAVKDRLIKATLYSRIQNKAAVPLIVTAVAALCS